MMVRLAVQCSGYLVDVRDRKSSWKVISVGAIVLRQSRDMVEVAAPRPMLWVVMSVGQIPAMSRGVLGSSRLHAALRKVALQCVSTASSEPMHRRCDASGIIGFLRADG